MHGRWSLSVDLQQYEPKLNKFCRQVRHSSKANPEIDASEGSYTKADYSEEMAVEFPNK